MNNDDECDLINTLDKATLNACAVNEILESASLRMGDNAFHNNNGMILVDSNGDPFIAEQSQISYRESDEEGEVALNNPN